jgi:serine/threonine-protein kinase
VTTTLTPDFADASARFAAALAGQYELEREIGRGGMGIVYLARDLKLDRRVAIKTLPPHLAADPTVRERFLREARTAGRLSHPNIVQIHRADELDGHVFFVMGFVDGESLAQRIRRQGRLDPREVRQELRDVASALGFAHEHGVIHRDVKAENILIERATGRALVTDFGIARLAEAAPLTATGQVLGTVYYLSPEQVSGEPVDARSDIYSLGVVGYFALSGRFPFDAELASAVLIAHVTKTPPPMRDSAGDCPRALAAFVDRCLAKRADDRYQSAREVVAALDAMAGEVEAAAPVTLPVPGLPALISDTEAQSIFGRAAELQAMTGVVPRPAPASILRDQERDAARTSGFKPADVRDAAVEAGIDPRYVDHALEERGLAPARQPVERPIVVVERSKPNMAAGAPTVLEFEVVVDGEMPDDDYDLMADHIRRVTRDSGQVGSVGRSFSWQPSPHSGRLLHVSVLSRHGKTTIRVSEHLKRASGGIFGGIVGGAGGGTSGIWMAIGANTHNFPLAFGLWIVAIGATYLTARGIFMITSNRRADELRALAETLASQARESIAAAKPKLPRPS